MLSFGPNRPRGSRGVGRPIKPTPDAGLDPFEQLRQALQELLLAAAKAGDFLPGGIPEGLALREAIIKARRFV